MDIAGGDAEVGELVRGWREWGREVRRRMGRWEEVEWGEMVGDGRERESGRSRFE